MSARNSVPAIDTGAIRKVSRPSALRRVAKVTGYVLGSIVMLVVLAVTFLHTPWGKSFVRGRVEKALAKKINGSVTVGSLDYGFLFGTVSLGNVEIRDASGGKAIAVHQVHLALDRGALLSKEIVLDELAITDLDVHLVKRADGTSNLTGLFKPSPAQKPMKHVQIKQLSLSGAATITKPGKTITVKDLWIAGRADLHPAAKQTALSLDKVSAHVSVNAKELDVALANIVLGKTTTNIDLDIASIDAGALAIEKLAAHVTLDSGKPRGDQAITLGRALIDADKLAALAGRKILVDDIALSLSLVGPADKLAVQGSIASAGYAGTRSAPAGSAKSIEAPNRTTLTLDGVLDIVAAKPTYQLSLAAAGKATDVLVPRPGKKLPAIAADVRLDVKGQGIKAADLDAQFTLAAQAVGFEIASTGTVVAGTVDARLGVDGNVAEALDVLADAGIHVSNKVPRLGALDLDITAKGPLKGELAVALAPTKIALAGGTVALRGKATLVNKKLAGAGATITLAKLDLASLSKLAGRPPKAKGTLSGEIAIAKTATSKSAAFDLAVALADKPVVIAAKGTASPGSAVVADIEVRRASDSSVLAAIDAKLPLAGKKIAPNGTLSLSIDVARRQLAELASLLPPRLRAKLPVGDIAVHADIAGTPSAPSGTITVASKGRHDVVLTAAIAPAASGLTITTDGAFGLDKSTFATLHGTVAVPALFKGGALDIASARAGVTVDAMIDVPSRSVASLAKYRAKLAKLDGTIGGRIAITGAVKTPSLDMQLAWTGYRTAAGTEGETDIAVTGTPKQLAVTISHGKAVAITADIDRSVANRIVVDAKLRAAKTALMPLLPAFAAAKLAAADLGTLDGDMDANLVLVKDAAGTLGLEAADVKGTLDVKGGSFTLPNTKRRYKDITLSVAAEPAGIRIKSLQLHESDREKADRLLSISGLLGLSKMKPARVDLQLVARDWLVFGGEKFGKIDAPRASTSFDIGLAVDLTKPVIGVDATIKSLALRSPDRQERAHHVENISPAGDIVFVDGAQTRVGKIAQLPVLAQATAVAPKKRRALDIRVHIPTAIRIEQTPMDFMTKGELAITVREEGVKTRGALTMQSGTLMLFGHLHELTSGSITFSDQHPKGFMKVTFERKLPSYALRDLAANGDTAKISFEGSPTKPKASLSGAAGAAMADIMAMYNAGRPLSTARPGLPASNVIEAPRGDQLLMLTFMASNLPHLLFLDRISAWADPTRGYGQLTNMEAESYAKDNKSRVRAVVRPSTPGRSNAEVQYDRLLINDEHTAAGVSVRAGDRLGGGVGVFLEWSSR